MAAISLHFAGTGNGWQQARGKCTAAACRTLLCSHATYHSGQHGCCSTCILFAVLSMDAVVPLQGLSVHVLYVCECERSWPVAFQIPLCCSGLPEHCIAVTLPSLVQRIKEH